MTAVLAPLYRPSKWGELYHSLDHDHAMGGGAAGPGKTQCLIMDPLAQMVMEQERTENPRHPHYIGPKNSTGWALHLRRTMPQVEQTIVRAARIFPRMDPKASFNAQTHTWLFSSGYRYQFGHCKDPNSWEDYFSSQYTHIAFDELVQFNKVQYDNIASRCRSDDPVLKNMLKVRSMTNPVLSRDQMDNVSVDDPLWVRKEFVDPAPQGKVTLYREVKLNDGSVVRRTRCYLPALLSDNPNPEFARQCEASLRDLPVHVQQALIHGNWYAQYGSFYGDEWDPKVHTCKPFKIPSDWLRFRSMDWGFKSPGVVGWWAMDYDGNLFCEYELVFKGKTATEVAKMIRDREIAEKLWYGAQSRITGPADTQLWEKRGAGAVTMAQEMAKVGVNWVPADKTSRKRNAGLLLGRLKDHQNKTSQPGVVFFSTCDKCIKTLPTILSVVGDPEVPQDGGWDHAHDMVLYAMPFASHGRAGIPAMKSNKRSDYEERDDDDRGSAGYGDLL